MPFSPNFLYSLKQYQDDLDTKGVGGTDAVVYRMLAQGAKRGNRLVDDGDDFKVEVKLTPEQVKARDEKKPGLQDIWLASHDALKPLFQDLRFETGTGRFVVEFTDFQPYDGTTTTSQAFDSLGEAETRIREILGRHWDVRASEGVTRCWKTKKKCEAFKFWTPSMGYGTQGLICLYIGTDSNT